MNFLINIEKHASSISEYLANELKLNIEDKETLRYGLEVIFGTMIKVLVLVLVSLWLRILPQVVSATVTSGGLRSFSGGFHCRRYTHCLVFGTMIAITIGELSFEIAKNINLELLVALIGLTFIIGLFVVKKWAPADNPGKPIKNLEKVNKYRNLSIFYVLAWCIVMLSLLGIVEKTDFIISTSLASILSLWFQVFSITPAGYRWIENIDQAFDKIIQQGGGYHV